MTASAPASSLRGLLRFDEPMSAHTTWRVGGPADRWYQPADLDDLELFLFGLPEEEPLTWVGLGSNLLVRDGGIRGTVICCGKGMGRMERSGEAEVRVEAGAPCALVARFCTREGLTGAEFFTGIPGTMGGALAMNAGCFGGETWNLVESVETVDRRGKRRVRERGEFEVGYRRASGPAGEWFVAARLRLAPGETEGSMETMRGLLERRSSSQPTREANAGSVFRNPAGDHAGRLIEACGLKGTALGGARVSEKHANFIINTGGAKAAEIEALIELVAQRVESNFGIRLEREVRVIGEPAKERGDG